MSTFPVLGKMVASHESSNPHINPCLESEVSGEILKSEDSLQVQLQLFLQQSKRERFQEVLDCFSPVACLPDKNTQDSLWFLLHNIGFRPPRAEADFIVWWPYIKRTIKSIHTHPETVTEAQKVLFVLMFPRYFRPVSTQRERYAADITAVLLQKIKSAPPQQDIALQLMRWLCSGQNIHNLLSALWYQGHIQLVLEEILDKMDIYEADLMLDQDLPIPLQSCFIELKTFFQAHELTEHASIEELLENLMQDHSLFRHGRVFELLLLCIQELRYRFFQGENTILHLAAYWGHENVVRLLLKSGLSPNFANARGQNPLQLAAARGHAAVVGIFLDSGVDVNHVDKRVQPALHLAVMYGYPEVVQQFLSAKVNFNIINRQGQTALHLAASKGDKQMVKQLLEGGLNINLLDALGQTALHLAVMYGYPEVVQQFLSAKVNFNIINRQGQTALHLAASKGDKQMVKQLLEGGLNINLLDALGQTALHLAVMYGYPEVVQQFLSAKLNIQIINRQGHTFLHSTAVNVNSIVNMQGQTVLHLAASKGNKQMVKQLLKAGLNINLLDALGQTALHLAVIHNYSEVVQQFLSTKVNFNNIVNMQGQTVLHLAASKGDKQMVKQLLEAGVNINLVDELGQTALQLAALQGHEPVVAQLLATPGIKINHAKQLAAHHEVVVRVLSAGATPNIDNRDLLRTSLEWAMRQGCTEIGQPLLNDGAHPAMKTENSEACEKEFLYFNPYYYNVLRQNILKLFAYLCYLVVSLPCCIIMTVSFLSNISLKALFYPAAFFEDVYQSYYHSLAKCDPAPSFRTRC